MSGELQGHVSVVTGGNSGIGLGMAHGLARAGADVAIWSRNEQRNRAAVAELSQHGTRVLAVACDISDQSAVEEAFAQTVDGLGRIDSCFANAGAGPRGTRFLDMTQAEFHELIAINLEGTFLVLQGAARQMVAQGDGGSLVAVSSLTALQGQPRGQHYAASKAGMIAMVRACAVELARHGIRANAILPGWIETPMAQDMLDLPMVRERVLPRVPAGRWGQPDDFAGVAVYLAGPGSAYHSGDALLIDGAYRSF
jgi:NAD(P)-dependent dehydrogenase (short-subunit alcohol dehydrogenase family)